MTTVTIKDLFLDEELDQNAMADVRGGFFGLGALILREYESQSLAPYPADVDTGRRVSK
jgi:hypothetical protein